MSSSDDVPVRRPGPELDRLLALVDSSLGLVSVAARTTARSTQAARRVTSPVVRGLERLPVPTTRARALASALHRRGSPVREHLATAVDRVLDLVVPFVLEEVLRRVDLTDVVRRHVDLDRVVADVDLDAAVVRVDVEAVIDRLDFAALVTAVLEEIDLAAIAEQVIEAVDLPEIIRDSSGALTSDTVRGARLRSAAADQALARVRDRLLPHRNGSQPPTLPAVPAVPTGLAVPSGPEVPTPLAAPPEGP